MVIQEIKNVMKTRLILKSETQQRYKIKSISQIFNKRNLFTEQKPNVISKNALKMIVNKRN